MPYYCGIDPGLSGAIAFLGGATAMAWPLALDPNGEREIDPVWLERRLLEYNPRVVVLEQVQGFGGCSSAFKLGQSYGAIIVTVLSLRMRLERARPQTWQSELFGSLEFLHTKDTKKKSIELAEMRWPGACRHGHKENHNLADALCLAEYGRRMYGVA